MLLRKIRTEGKEPSAAGQEIFAEKIETGVDKEGESVII